MPPARAAISCRTFVTAVEAYATVGEISDTLRKVFGEYHEAVVI